MGFTESCLPCLLSCWLASPRGVRPWRHGVAPDLARRPLHLPQQDHRLQDLLRSQGERPKHRLVDCGCPSLVDRPGLHRRSRRQLQDNWGADQLQGLRLHLLQPEAPLGSTWQGSDCGDTSRGFDSRGTWSYGASALEIDFPQAKNTEWARGSDQWVGWIAKGGHWGGYTYRLCKLPEEGKSGLTEECFAKNVLEFAKPKTWWKRAGDEHVNDAWQTVSKIDLVEGTYPEGSAWRPVEKTVGQGKEAEYLIRKDKVKVPENLPEGDYVLSL